MPLSSSLAAILSRKKFFQIIDDYQTIGQKNLQMLPTVHKESDRFYAKNPLAKVVLRS